MNVDRFGNTSSGSIPLALADARAEGRLPDGALVLMTGMGAGLTWGSALIEWTQCETESGQWERSLSASRARARSRPAWAGRSQRRFRRRMEVYRVGSEASGLDLQKLCFDSPLEELVETEVQQPALVATCLAILAAMRERGIEPDVVVGHSVGEFAALASVGAIGIAEAIGLVRERGLAMAEAARQRPGSMAAILGLEDEAVETLCRQILGVWPANYNCPGQIVISGENEAVEECCAEAESLGARRAIKLKVSGRVPQPARRERRRAPQAGDRPRSLPRADRAVHVDGDREDRAGAAPRRAARRPADRAGQVHAGRARARARRRHHLRRGRPGQRALRPRQADRQERARPSPSTISPAWRRSRRRSRRERGSARWRGRRRSSRARREGSAGRSRWSSLRRAPRSSSATARARTRPRRWRSEIGGRAVQADVSDPESARALVEEAGDLDILVNNAGLTRDGLLARMSDDDWRDGDRHQPLLGLLHLPRASRGMMKKRAARS